MLKGFLIGAAVLVAAFIAFVSYVLFMPVVPNKAEQAFLDSLGHHLKKDGDWAMLSDIYPGDWKEVCFIPSMSTGGGNSPENIRRIFDITTKEINLPYGAPIASDWTSAAMFFYPPNTVVGLQIPTSEYLGFGTQLREGRGWCRRTKEEVVLLLHGSPLDPNARIVTVATLDGLEETLKLVGEKKDD